MDTPSVAMPRWGPHPVPVLSGDGTRLRPQGQPVGVVAVDLGSGLPVDPAGLDERDAEALTAWLSERTAQSKVDVVVTDKLASYGTAAAVVGRRHSHYAFTCTGGWGERCGSSSRAGPSLAAAPGRGGHGPAGATAEWGKRLLELARQIRARFDPRGKEQGAEYRLSTSCWG